RSRLPRSSAKDRTAWTASGLVRLETDQLRRRQTLQRLRKATEVTPKAATTRRASTGAFHIPPRRHTSGQPPSNASQYVDTESDRAPQATRNLADAGRA